MQVFSDRRKMLILAVLSEIGLIVSISIANFYSGLWYCIFYNMIYGLVLSTVVPLFLLFREGMDLRAVGVKKIGVRQTLVLLIFVVFSIGGQLIPLMIKGTHIRFELLPICVLPLIMTTFFEEFLFRGFFQTQIDLRWGWFPALIVSALMFSLYHLGYPGFRTAGDLVLLFFVGLGFAIAFKLSDNNLIVSYFVNLPNAFVTYMFKAEQFPAFEKGTSTYAIITIGGIIAILAVFISKTNRNQNKP